MSVVKNIAQDVENEIKSILEKELGLTGKALTAALTSIENLGVDASLSSIEAAIASAAELGGVVVSEGLIDTAAAAIAAILAL
jgi:hypothetical protein